MSGSSDRKTSNVDPGGSHREVATLRDRRDDVMDPGKERTIHLSYVRALYIRSNLVELELDRS